MTDLSESAEGEGAQRDSGSQIIQASIQSSYFPQECSLKTVM